MDNFVDFIINEALIVVPVLIIIGKIIKETPKVPNWTIPYLLLVCGVTFTVAIMGLNVDAFVQGVLVTGMAVFTNQAWKQLTYPAEVANRDNKKEKGA